MGLLEGAGLIFGAGVAGAGKSMNDTFADQVKSDALARREENLARIQQLYATDLQKRGQKHASDESKAARDQAVEFEKNRVENEKERTALTRESLALQKKALADDAAYKKLVLEAPGPTLKLYNDLKKIPGLDKERLAGYIVGGLSGEKQDRADYVKMFSSYVDILAINAKANMTPITDEQIEDAARRAGAATGYSPKRLTLGAAKPTKDEDNAGLSPVERAKKAAGTSGSDNKAYSALPERIPGYSPRERKVLTDTEMDWVNLPH